MKNLCVSIVASVVAAVPDSGCLVLYHKCSVYYLFAYYYTHFQKKIHGCQVLHCIEGK